MKVRNMTSAKGNTIPNQIIVEDGETETFISYGTTIVKKEYGTRPAKITLDKLAWNYSQTTSKYRNLFLGETTKETEAKIKSGEYTLAHLNGNG